MKSNNFTGVPVHLLDYNFVTQHAFCSLPLKVRLMMFRLIKFIEDLKSIFNKPAPFPENRDKKIIEEEASFFLRFIDTISKLIALPVDEGTKLPIEPKDYSDDFPTKWFYELS